MGKKIKACPGCKIRVVPKFKTICDYCLNLPFKVNPNERYEDAFKRKVKEGIYEEKFVVDEIKKKA